MFGCDGISDHATWKKFSITGPPNSHGVQHCLPMLSIFVYICLYLDQMTTSSFIFTTPKGGPDFFRGPRVKRGQNFFQKGDQNFCVKWGDQDFFMYAKGVATNKN